VATTAGDSHEEHGENTEHKSWAGQWSDADKRLFLITFLGGLAANVGLVLVVALAILASRAVAWYVRTAFVNSPPRNIVLMVVLAYFLATVGWHLYRQRHPTKSQLGVRVTGAVAWLPCVLLLLGLLGYLAGLR
jgi:hypothetical protein